MSRIPRLGWIAAGGIGLVLVLVAVLRPQPKPAQAPAPVVAAASRPAALQGVAALGRLEPAGDVRKLAAPSGGMGISPRVSALYVREGDRVQRGQLLASFDNRPGLLAQRELLLTRIQSLSQQLRILEAQTARYRGLTRSGANPAGDLDAREIQLSERRGQLSEARAELKRLNTEITLSELRSPINGLVLRVDVQPGERPDANGIVEVGASQAMEVVAEVYESDISRIRVGQPVTVESESGGFKGQLRARVLRISPQVRQRRVLSTDPSADADARIVEVRLALDPAEAQRVQSLAGLKVIARFQP
ncbi:MAG: HlyD family efflux transporter periplasmic adaptor subunit [Cyanobacteria bacterium K_Offshore_0m_m2_072]|nr:HlyD family efflux transporter periplasmic adaptor subunit [Cyanobacteria bacterium K_Offshore_0m_m2_072]